MLSPEGRLVDEACWPPCGGFRAVQTARRQPPGPGDTPKEPRAGFQRGAAPADTKADQEQPEAGDKQPEAYNRQSEASWGQPGGFIHPPTLRR